MGFRSKRHLSSRSRQHHSSSWKRGNAGGLAVDPIVFLLIHRRPGNVCKAESRESLALDAEFRNTEFTNTNEISVRSIPGLKSCSRSRDSIDPGSVFCKLSPSRWHPVRRPVKSVICLPLLQRFTSVFGRLDCSLDRIRRPNLHIATRIALKPR